MLSQLASGKRVLIAVAAPAEARAVLEAFGHDPRLSDQPWTLHALDAHTDLVVTGVGKGCAAGGVARVIDPRRHAGVISAGIAGTLDPRRAGLLSVVLADACVLGDEGILAPSGFTDIARAGFPPVPGGGIALPTSAAWVEALRACAQCVGAIATVSTCSGTDALAREIRERTGALAEAMEGAAIATVATRLALACAELRVISNTTGDRDNQHWDLRGALARLGEVLGRMRS